MDFTQTQNIRDDGRFFNEIREIKIKFRGKEIVINSFDVENIAEHSQIKLEESTSSQSETVTLSQGLNSIKTEIVPIYTLNNDEKTTSLLSDQVSPEKFLHIRSAYKTDTFNISRLKNAAITILNQISTLDLNGFKINVTILQDDNKQSSLFACILNSIIVCLILKGVPIKDCSFGMTVSSLNDQFIPKECILGENQKFSCSTENLQKNNLMYDPTENEENSNATLTVDCNFHRKTLNYCELQGMIHVNQFRSMLKAGLDCSQETNSKIVNWLRSIKK